MDKINEFINEFLLLLPEGVNFDINNLSLLLSPKDFFTALLSAISLDGISDFVSVMTVASLVIFISTVYETKLTSVIESSSCIVFLLGVSGGLISLVSDVGKSLCDMGKFFSSLSPLLVSVSLFGGGKNLSSTLAIQMSLTSSMIELFAGEALVPLVFSALILGVASALGGPASPRILGAIKNLFTKALGFISVISAALFSLQSIIASATDSASLRLAKFTAQSLAPSVGTVITSSMSTLASGVGYAKGVIGAGAVYVILIMTLSALPSLLLYRLALSFSESACEIMGTKIFSRALSGVRYAVDSLISAYLIFSSMFILQFILFIRSGAGAL